MLSEKKFRTKTGFCHVLPDKIVLTRDGVVGNVSEVVVGNNIVRILSIYALLSIGFFYFSINAFRNGTILSAVLFGIIGLYLVYGIFNSLNNSAVPVIKRKRITEVKFKNSIKGVTRSRFEVLFKNENGKIKKRLIMLPGSLSDGEGETKKAIDIFREENLL